MWGYVLWAAVLVIMIGMLVNLRSKYSIYVCPRCEHQFTLSPGKEFFFPQIMYRKLAKCPECRKLVAARIIKNEEAIAKLEKAREKNSNQANHKKSKKKNNQRR